MAKEKEIYTLGIAVLGNFNPVIITPFWLSSKELIREIEAETAKVEVIHPDLTRFEIDWFSFEATPTRIDFKTKRESHFQALKDLIVSVFSNLKETPVKAFGINHLCHFSMRDFKEYENFGYWLSPAKKLTDVMNNPKLQSIQFLETKTENNEDGLIRLTISPSDLLNDRKSVVFNCNHHFEIQTTHNAKEMIKILNEKWEFSFQKVENLNNKVWEIAEY